MLVGINSSLRFLRSSNSTVKIILPLLIKRVKSSSAASRYIICLELLTKTRGTSYTVSQNASLLADLVSMMNALGYGGAVKVMNAILPIIKVKKPKQRPIITFSSGG